MKKVIFFPSLLVVILLCIVAIVVGGKKEKVRMEAGIFLDNIRTVQEYEKKHGLLPGDPDSNYCINSDSAAWADILADLELLTVLEDNEPFSIVPIRDGPNGVYRFGCSNGRNYISAFFADKKFARSVARSLNMDVEISEQGNLIYFFPKPPDKHRGDDQELHDPYEFEQSTGNIALLF